jgi:phosphoribosylformylglycinamidine synthase PurS subunit
MRFKVDVYITLKRTVNDPEGLTIKGALAQLGFDEIDQLRAGKYFEVWLDAPDEATAAQRVDTMCDKLLANPVIEDYHVEVQAEAGG